MDGRDKPIEPPPSSQMVDDKVGVIAIEDEPSENITVKDEPIKPSPDDEVRVIAIKDELPENITVKDEPIEPSLDDGVVYLCKPCNKVFATRQSLDVHTLDCNPTNLTAPRSRQHASARRNSQHAKILRGGGEKAHHYCTECCTCVFT